ncbi:MAG TPA: DUF2007 domain-containing protein [Terriglobales bacterium]|jgi:hypothetical protein|nr:DUF2007 domain-containing protein [Terriglobales bacterium]
MDTKPELTAESESQRALDNAELVEVFDTQQESEALVVKGLLESAGIESVMTGLDAPQEVLPGVGGVIIRVLPDQAEEARRVIEEYRAHPVEESDVTDDSAA